ncbi:MAG: Peptide/nickel transport system substrate-binding protein [Rhodospirillales bacterium]|jgi:peptide/nickel transport system substrate-binding protein|nr:Peptide/nickel transport system substrate-binding protein [Rhodospirillales bacterium]
MHRRNLLSAAAALAVAPTLSRPSLGAEPKTLIHVPQASMGSLDPVWTTAVVTRNAGAMLWDTLYGRDERLNARPQMIEGHNVEDGGKRWTMRLREGMFFHDGEPVRSRDCVASIRRWMKRDLVGQTIEARLDALEAPDDRTLVFRLKAPFSSLPYALAKTQPTPVIMPERLALTDPHRQVPEFIGSGPFRWVADEYVHNSRAVFAKNERYRPRDEPVSFCAGGYRVKVDRVEWRFIPDPATAANALINGEVDWIDQPLPDLLPLLRRARGVNVEVLDSFGTFGAIRPNCLHGATGNAAIRRVMLAAVDQVACMTAAMGTDPSLFRAPVGYFLPGTPSANDAGMAAVLNRPSMTEVKRMLAATGYANERIVLMHPTDQSFYHAMTSVVAANLREAGFNLDEQSMDWGTIVQRRTNREPLERGGWSLFPAGFPAAEYRDPVFATNLHQTGSSAWFGWPEDAEVEAMRARWMDTTDEAEQQRLDRSIQARSFETVPFIPLGQYLPPTAYRRNITGLLKGAVPVFWNVDKG